MVAASTAASSTFAASGTAARSVGSEELNSTPARAGQRREGGHAHSRGAAGKEHGEVEGGD